MICKPKSITITFHYNLGIDKNNINRHFKNSKYAHKNISSSKIFKCLSILISTVNNFAMMKMQVKIK